MLSDLKMSKYELFYWHMIPGRGEFVRRVFAEAGVAYDDVARKPEEEGGGIAAVSGGQAFLAWCAHDLN
jgi:glutathione S-transferase